MKNILVNDISIRQGNDNNSMTFKEKLEFIKNLCELNVDVIELGFAQNKTDEVLFKTACSVAGNTKLAVNVDSEELLDKSFALIKSAKNKKIIISIPSSPSKMEYSASKKPKAVLELINSITAKAKSLCDDVEVEFADATRADSSFLYGAIDSAIQSGADSITVCDETGIFTAEEFGTFIDGIFNNVDFKNVLLNVSVSDEYSMGIANAFVAFNKGVSGIKVSAFSSKGCVYLKTFSMAMENIGLKHGFSYGINKTVINKILVRLKGVSSESEQKTVSENKDAVIKNVTPEKIKTSVKKLGYELSEEDTDKVISEVKRISEKKPITSKELEIIIANTALQVPETYSLNKFLINASNVVTDSASVSFIKNGKEISGISFGNGPIDAAFLAIEKIIGEHFELEDFQIGAITEGKEAVGQAIVKLRSEGKIFSGTGISTDIIGASIRAYLNALNKILYERGNK